MERLWRVPSLALESRQSQDEDPQIPGSSGQHWVLHAALIAEKRAVDAGLMQQLCVCVLTSALRVRNTGAYSDKSQPLKGRARPSLRHPRQSQTMNLMGTGVIEICLGPLGLGLSMLIGYWGTKTSTEPPPPPRLLWWDLSQGGTCVPCLWSSWRILMEVGPIMGKK